MAGYVVRPSDVKILEKCFGLKLWFVRNNDTRRLFVKGSGSETLAVRLRSF